MQNYKEGSIDLHQQQQQLDLIPLGLLTCYLHSYSFGNLPEDCKPLLVFWDNHHGLSGNNSLFLQFIFQTLLY
jgi:hypothetical protein